MLQNEFYALTNKYGAPPDLITSMWREIELAYSASGRHYHTLTHLRHLFGQLHPCSSLIQNPDAVGFAVYYHDIVYQVLRHDNEEKSAEVAAARMAAMSVPPETINQTTAMILASKAHTLSTASDTNLFTDADLSILGSDENGYDTYTQMIRQEYSIYPNLLYNPGRAKVLRHFLQMEYIYKTEYFRNAYESSARVNLARELKRLE